MNARELLAAAKPRPWHAAADTLYSAPTPAPPVDPFDEEAWEAWFDGAQRISWGDVDENDAALAARAVNEYEALLDIEDAARDLLQRDQTIPEAAAHESVLMRKLAMLATLRKIS